MITIIDLETTGLMKPIDNEIGVQPYIIEICAIQFKDGEVNYELDTLVKPPIPIPNHIKKITGIDDSMVKDSPTFAEIYRKLVDVFFGSHTVVAHNLSFDEGVLIQELKRLGKEYAFPYPPIKFCTVEQSLHLKGYRLKNDELYEIATGKTIEGAHRAKTDVLATWESYKFLKGRK